MSSSLRSIFSFLMDKMFLKIYFSFISNNYANVTIDFPIAIRYAFSTFVMKSSVMWTSNYSFLIYFLSINNLLRSWQKNSNLKVLTWHSSSISYITSIISLTNHCAKSYTMPFASIMTPSFFPSLTLSSIVLYSTHPLHYPWELNIYILQEFAY